MIQYIELLAEPLAILTLGIIVFNGFEWFLCGFADFLGIGCDED
tara:strand:- start:90 stop:221 length:132 start_codon:yes stop_codon:yes gene_type:complete